MSYLFILNLLSDRFAKLFNHNVYFNHKNAAIYRPSHYKVTAPGNFVDTKKDNKNKASIAYPSHKKVNVSQKEWETAKKIADKLITSGTKAPFIISFSEWQNVYPDFKHSFILNDTNTGPKLGVIPREHPYIGSNGEKISDKGILGVGKNGKVKLVVWEDGTEDAVKISPDKNHDQSSKALKKLGILVAEFTQKRNKATPWVVGRNGTKKTIKDKKYQVIKKAHGIPLRKFLNINKPDLSQKLELAKNIAEQVSLIHSKNVIHGDLNHLNILVNSNNRKVDIVDYDTALVLDANQTEVVLGKPKGSRSLMAPEIGVYRPRWEKVDHKWIKKEGLYQSQEGRFSKASDIYALGALFKNKLQFKNAIPELDLLIEQMQHKNPKNRPSIDDVTTRLNKIHLNDSAQKKPDLISNNVVDGVTITPGQALLILIKAYAQKDPKLADQYKYYYLNGFITKDDLKIFDKIKKDPHLKGYIVNDNAKLIADDPSRRYFETHLSLETMKNRANQISKEQLLAHYQSIKDGFTDLGGDINTDLFKNSGVRKLVRNYEEESLERKQKGLNEDDLVKGISRQEQKKLDRLFSGSPKSSDNDMFREYNDLIKRVNNHPELNQEQKDKINLVIKSTRLGMILNNKIKKYKKMGIYQGPSMPLGEVYGDGIYLPENRGRISKDDNNRTSANHTHMGLIKGHNPLAEDDAANSLTPYDYYKPADRSDFNAKSVWSDECLSRKVNTCSNALSGTMLVQLRNFAKLQKEGKLTLDNKNKMRNYLSLMMSAMTAISGGHSLLEFSGPTKIEAIQEELKNIKGFKDLDLNEFFVNDNEAAFDKALDNTIQYNEHLLNKAKIHKELIGENKNESEHLPFVPTKKANDVLNHYLLKQQNPKLLANKLQVKPTDFTYMNQNNTYQSPEKLDLMAKATQSSKIEMASFKPERLLLHEVASYVSAFIRTKDEQSRNEEINSTTDLLKPRISKEMSDLYEKVRHDVENEIEHNINPQHILNMEVTRALKEAKSIYEKKNPGKIEELALEIATHRIYTEKAAKIIEEIVKNHYQSKNANFKQSMQEKEPCTRFISGGSASGKGTLVANILEEAKKQGINPQDIVYLNNDSYKSLIKTDKTDELLFSQLTQDEARIIRNKTYDKATKANMNILVDQVSMSHSATNHTLKENGQVSGAIVSTHAMTAIKRAFERAKVTGRYEHTEGLLQGHKNSPLNALTYLKKYKGKKVYVDFLDNNSDRHEQPTLFMRANLLDKKITILNEDMLQEYIKKQFINPQATTYDEIFPNDDSFNLDLEQAKNKYIEALEHAGFEVQCIYKPRPKPRKHISPLV